MCPISHVISEIGALPAATSVSPTGGPLYDAVILRLIGPLIMCCALIGSLLLAAKVWIAANIPKEGHNIRVSDVLAEKRED